MTVYKNNQTLGEAQAAANAATAAAKERIQEHRAMLIQLTLDVCFPDGNPSEPPSEKERRRKQFVEALRDMSYEDLIKNLKELVNNEREAAKTHAAITAPFYRMIDEKNILVNNFAQFDARYPKLRQLAGATNDKEIELVAARVIEYLLTLLRNNAVIRWLVKGKI